MLPLHPGGRIPGHQPDPVLVAAVTCAIPPNICPCVGDDDQCLATGTQVTAADGRISAAQLGDRDATTMGRRVEGFVAAVASIQSAFWFRCMADGTCDVDRRVGNQAIRPPIFLQEHRARSGMNRGGNQASRLWQPLRQRYSVCSSPASGGCQSIRRILHCHCEGRGDAAISGEQGSARTNRGCRVASLVAMTVGRDLVRP